MKVRCKYCNDRKMIDTSSTGSGTYHPIPCPECSGCSGCKEKQKRMEELEGIIRSALDNADRLPFVLGIQFEDAKRMRKTIKGEG